MIEFVEIKDRHKNILNTPNNIKHLTFDIQNHTTINLVSKLNIEFEPCVVGDEIIHEELDC